LDVFEILEHWLIQIIDDPHAKPKELVQKLSKKYGKR